MVIINNANNYIDSISGALSACDLLKRFSLILLLYFLLSDSVRFDRLAVWEKKFSFGFCHLMIFSSVLFRFLCFVANLPALHFGFLLINLTSTSARHRIYDLVKTYFSVSSVEVLREHT